MFGWMKNKKKGEKKKTKTKKAQSKKAKPVAQPEPAPAEETAFSFVGGEENAGDSSSGFAFGETTEAADAESGFSFGTGDGDDGTDEASGFSFGAAPAEDAPGSDSFSFGAADVSQEPPVSATPAAIPAPAPAPKPAPVPVTATTKPKMNFNKSKSKRRKKKKKAGIGMFGRSTPAPAPEPVPAPAPEPAPEPAPAPTPSNPPPHTRGAPPALPSARNRSAPPPKPAPAVPPARKPEPAPAPAPAPAVTEPETQEDDDFAADIDDFDSNAVGMFGGMELHEETTTEPQDADNMFGGMDDELPDTGAEEDGDALAGLEGMHGTDTGADDLNGLGEVDYTPTKHDKLQQIISKLGQDCQGVSGKLQGCRDQRCALVLQRQAKVERTAALKLEIKQKESAISEACARDDYALAEELENALTVLKARVSEMEAESDSLGTQARQQFEQELQLRSDQAALVASTAQELDQFYEQHNVTQATQHEEATAQLDMKGREMSAAKEDLKNKTERLDRERTQLDDEREKINSKIAAEAKQDTEALGRAKDKKQQLLSEIEELLRQVKEKRNFVASTDATIASASANIRAIEKRFEGTITLLNNRQEALNGDVAVCNNEKALLQKKTETLEEDRATHAANHKEYLVFLVGCKSSSGTLKLLEKGLTTARECKTAISSDNDADEQDSGIGPLQNQLAASDKKLADLKEKIASVESAQFQANDTIASISARIPGLEDQKKAHAKARRFKQAGAVSKQIKSLKEEQVKAEAAIVTAKQDFDTFNKDYQQEEAATAGLRSQLVALQKELKERKSGEDMKAIERLRVDIGGIVAIESKLESLETQEEAAEHLGTYRPLRDVVKLATAALAGERALLEKELSALCDRQNLAHLKDVSDVDSKLPTDLDVSFDLNVNVDSAADPATDVARLAEIGAEISELDARIQEAANSDDYELADSLDAEQKALVQEREAINARLSEAREVAVDSKVQLEQELSALEAEVEAAAENEDYDRAAELAEKESEIKNKIQELDAIIAAASAGPSDAAAATSRLEEVETELKDLLARIETAAGNEDYDTAGELQDKVDVLEAEQAKLKKEIEEFTSNEPSLLDMDIAPAAPTTELDPFASMEATPAPAADLDPFAGVDNAGADPLAGFDKPEITNAQPESDPFASAEPAGVPPVEQVDPFAGVEDAAIPAEAEDTATEEAPAPETVDVQPESDPFASAEPAGVPPVEQVDPFAGVEDAAIPAEAEGTATEEAPAPETVDVQPESDPFAGAEESAFAFGDADADADVPEVEFSQPKATIASEKAANANEDGEGTGFSFAAGDDIGEGSGFAFATDDAGGDDAMDSAFNFGDANDTGGTENNDTLGSESGFNF